MAEAVRTPEKTAIIKAVEEYVSHGCAVAPLYSKSKKPFGLAWGENLVCNVADVPERFAGGKNVGIHLGKNNLMSLDIDEPVLARILFKGLGLDLDALLNSGHRLTGKPGGSRTLFRVPPGFPKNLLKDMHYVVSAARVKAAGLPVNGAEGDINILELRGGSFQDVLPPSVHPGGHLYAWHPDGAGPLKSPKDAPEVPASLAMLWVHLGAGRAHFDKALGLVTAANDERMSANFDDWSVLDGIGKLESKGKKPLTARALEFREVAEAFGEHHGHDFGALLEEGGYTAVEVSEGVTKWLRPGSTTGAPGVEIMRDKKHIQSHGGDKLNDGKPKDFFQTWAILNHWDDERGGPNLGAAIREAAAVVGMTLTGGDADADEDFGSIDGDDTDTAAPAEPVQAGVKPAAKTTKTRRPLVAYTPGELKDQPPAQWLVKGVIPEAGEVVVFGPSGSGKSFATLDLAMCIVRGEPWQGRKTQQGRVIYVAAEGAGSYRQRLQAYEGHHRFDASNAPFHLVQEAINLTDSEDVARVVDLAKSLPTPPALVIVDTLARSMAGADENSSTDMGKAVAGAGTIREQTGATVLLVHHSGKDTSKGARGSSSLRAAVDTELEVSPGSKEKPHTVKLTKSRTGEHGAEFSFKLMPVYLGADEDGEPVSVPAVQYVNAPAPAKKVRSGPWVDAVRAALDLVPFGESVKLGALVASIVKVEDAAGRRVTGKDRRPERIKEAVETLRDAGELKFDGVTVTPPNPLD